MRRKRSNLFLGSFFIIIFILMIILVYSITKEPSLITTVIVIPLTLLSFLFFIMGYKLIRYEAIHQVTLDDIRRKINKHAKSKGIVAAPIAIIFSGIDGSGKTTQIKLIAKCLKERGLKYKYIWLRSASYTSLLFSAFFHLLKYVMKKDLEYGNKVIVKVKCWLFTIDMFIRSIIRIRIPMKMGYYILCDRFVLDAIVDIISEKENIDPLRSIIGKLLLALNPRRSITIVLDVDEHEAYKRKMDIINVDYLKKRRRLYIKMADILRIPIIDGTKDPERVHKEIIEKILAHHPIWYVFNKKNEE